MIGVALNQYQVTARVGAGGMGEVFRARDTRLNRDVAIKVLPKDFAADADRLRRFAIVRTVPGERPRAEMQVVLGFFSELERLAKRAR